MSRRAVSRSTTVAARPEAVFDLLADPRRHAEVDGSGTVRSAVHAPERLSLGARFRMRMLFGIPYLISNEVVEFEEGRRIAWRHFGHHVWRYELAEVAGGTQVTETFDWATARSPRALELLQLPQRNTASIEATLRRFEERFGVPPSA